MEEILMAKGAKTLVEVCLNVKENEEVLIVSELSKLKIAKAIASAVYASKANPMIITMLQREEDGQEPPLTIAKAMETSDAFVCCVEKSITHTKAVKNACEKGSRGILNRFSMRY